MRRLTSLVLLLLVVTLSITGCYTNKAEKNENSVAAGTSLTTAANKTNSNTTAPSAADKDDIKNMDSSAEKTSEITQAGPTASNSNTITLMITRDFGKQVLFKQPVSIGSNSTIMDVLQANTDVTTKYDGNYVSSIKGLESHNGGISGSNSDWFYYINGICSDAGAGDYTLKPGEIIWWDYHAWKNMGFVNSAVIGCYPEPFIHGYRGKVVATTIMSSADNLKLAEEMAKALKAKGASVNMVELNNNLLEKRTNPTIVIGTWNELTTLAWINNFNHAYRKTGTSIHFTDNSLELLDFSGNSARTISGSAGIIAASGSGLGDGHPLWMIAGTDQVGLQQAVELLSQNPDKISGLYSTAILSGEIIRLPLP